MLGRLYGIKMFGRLYGIFKAAKTHKAFKRPSALSPNTRLCHTWYYFNTKPDTISKQYLNALSMQYLVLFQHNAQCVWCIFQLTDIIQTIHQDFLKRQKSDGIGVKCGFQERYFATDLNLYVYLNSIDHGCTYVLPITCFTMWDLPTLL